MPTPTHTPTPTLTPTPIALVTVQIACILFDGQVFRSESDEYVEIFNSGNAAQELSGWKLKELKGQDDKFGAIFEFPSWTLGSGEVIRVYTNEIHPEWGGFSFGSGRAVWNNTTADTAQLFDENDQLIDSESYNLDDGEGVCSVAS